MVGLSFNFDCSVMASVKSKLRNRGNRRPRRGARSGAAPGLPRIVPTLQTLKPDLNIPDNYMWAFEPKEGDNVQMVCEICGLHTDTDVTGHVIEHTMIVHADLSDSELRRYAEVKKDPIRCDTFLNTPRKCQICPKITSNKLSGFHHHEEHRLKDYALKCPYCFHHEIYFTALRVHLWRKHDIKIDDPLRGQSL